jgi:flagellar biogenesis protein FliO
MALRRHITLGAFAVALAAGANVALSQATKPATPAAPPAAVDAYQNVPLPTPRGGATTQTTVGGAKTTSTSDPLDTRRVAFALGIVLVAIYAGHRVWRRLGMPGSTNKAGQTLQVVSRLAVSPKQQVLLIRVGRRFVLVGNSGTQMNPLCEITDPDEAAALLGQTVTESRESSTATFHDVLDGAQGRFDAEIKSAQKSPEDDPEISALNSARDELNSMVDKVRSLSKQFQHGRA